MEEVWKELSLSSLHHHCPTTGAAIASATPPQVPGLSLQEFLACPFDQDTVPKSQTTNQITASKPQRKTMNTTTILAVGEPETPSSFTPSSSSSSSIISLPTDAAFCPCSKPKRGPADVDENASDRKKHRLMKNRESASRSRARKQAYTCELELEVAHLMKENAKLRKEQEKLFSMAQGDLHQKKYKLQRTLTAPF